MKRKIPGSFLLLFILIFTNNLLAQTGTLKGIVTDETGAPAFDVTVLIPNLKLGTITGFEGEYEIKNIPPGIYKIYFKGVGYQLDSLTGIEIKADETTVIDKKIYGEGVLTVDIVKEKNQGSLATQIEDVKKNDKVLTQVGGEELRKSSDRNAADALRRLPGVSLIENRFIMVRGLAERYNSVWLNDATAPSSEPDKKAFSFDIIQSSLIDKLQIYKTPAPDLPGDFSGGMAKIYTRASAPKKDFQISIQGSYRQNSTFNTMDYTNSEKWDFLGFGAKARSLPSIVPDRINKTDNNYSEVSRAFANTWGVKHKQARPDLRLSGYYANRFKIKRWDLGTTSALSYSNLNTVYRIKRYDWDGYSQNLGTSEKQSSNLVNFGAIQNFSLIVNARNSFQFRNLFNQSAADVNTVKTNENNGLQNSYDQRSYAFGYQSRQVYTTQLSGIHGNDSITDLRWTLGYSKSNRLTPDLRRIRYSKPPEASEESFSANVPQGVTDPVFGGGRFFSDLNENTKSANLAYRQRVKLFNYKFHLNTGFFIEHKAREFNARVLGYVLFKPKGPQNLYIYKPLDQLFSDTYVGIPGGFRMDEITDPGDSYKAQNKLYATYLSTNFTIGDRIKILGGARYEYNIQQLQSFSNAVAIDTAVKSHFVLPSINLSYKLTEKSLLRAAAGKTLNRPEFREWAPFKFYDFDFNALTFGSLFPTEAFHDPKDPKKGTVLKVAEIMNYDLRYELYPSELEMFHVGAFYKTFKNPIQQVITVSGGTDGKQFTFTNAQSAYSYGVEVDIRKNLGFIRDNNFFKKLNVVANASIIRSEVTNNKLLNQLKNNPLPGQSPYLYNFGFYYQSGADSNALQVTLLYNVFGPRVFFVGTQTYPSIGEMARHSLDLTINKALSKRVGLLVSAQDLLNVVPTFDLFNRTIDVSQYSQVLLVQDTNQNGKFERNENKDKPIMKYKRGGYFSVGVRIQL